MIMEEQKKIPAWKKLYDKRKELCLCVRCGKPLEEGRTHYCEECRKKYTDYRRESKQFFRKIGICPECGKNKLFGDEKMCPECLARQAERRARHPISDDKQKEYSETFKEYSRNLYAERKKAGICTKCGKRKAVQGKAKCAICQSKDNAIHRKRNEKKQNIREYRRENHLCYFCGEPIGRPQGQICQKCWQMFHEKAKSSKRDNSKHCWRRDNRFLKSQR